MKLVLQTFMVFSTLFTLFEQPAADGSNLIAVVERGHVFHSPSRLRKDAARCLLVATCHDVEEVLLAEVLHLRGVPLAADEQQCSEEVGMGDVEVERHHATHRLACGVESVRVHFPFLNIISILNP